MVMEYNLVQAPGKIYPDAGLDVLTTVKYFRDHAIESQMSWQILIAVKETVRAAA
ncbi:hypothetical protein IMAU20062_01960 [Lactobacillus helveticus]|nr:hypothetical protein [Lactobacillus helveticus]